MSNDDYKQKRSPNRFLRIIIAILATVLGGSALLNVQIGDITIATYIFQKLSGQPPYNDLELTQTQAVLDTQLTLTQAALDTQSTLTQVALDTQATHVASTQTQAALDTQSTQIALQMTQTAIVGGKVQGSPSPVIASPTIQSPPKQCIGALDITERDIPAQTVVIGDVIVNGEDQFDGNPNDALHGFPEGTTVFFEIAGTVSAPYGATCFPATSLEAFWELMLRDYETGCSTGCATERLVIVRESGTVVTYYPDVVSTIEDLNRLLNPSDSTTQVVQLCPPDGVQKTGSRQALNMNLNVPAGYVQYLGGSGFDEDFGHVFVEITGPYSGNHLLYEGAYCEPVQVGSGEDRLAKSQITREVESGGVDCPDQCQYVYLPTQQ